MYRSSRGKLILEDCDNITTQLKRDGHRVHLITSACLLLSAMYRTIATKDVSAKAKQLAIQITLCVRDKWLHSCPTLRDPMDGNPPGSSVRGILQARILKWVSMPSSQGSSKPRVQTCVSNISCIGR